MDDPDTRSGVSLDRTLDAFARTDDPAAPLTAREVATAVGCSRETARSTLEALTERGDLRSKAVGTNSETRVWWSPNGTDGREADEDGGRRRQATDFETFVRAVEGYAVFLLDPNGRVTDWNRGAERIYGCEASELQGKHISTFSTRQDIERGIPNRNLSEAAERGRSEGTGWRLRGDGSKFWGNVVFTAVRDHDGDLRGFTKIVRDTTERREQRIALRRERAQTEKLLQTSPVATIVEDADGSVVTANQRSQALLGISEEELVDERHDPGAWSVYDAEGNLIEEMPSERVHETGEPVFDEELVVENPDGERRWFSVNAAPVFNAVGDLERVVVTGQDVTPIKKRERELESELGEILGRVSDAFYALDAEWRFTHVNERAEELLDHTEAELLGETVWEVFPEATTDAVSDELRTAMETTEPTSFEQEYPRIDACLEFNVYPSETGLSVYFRDVSERKARERELERYHTIVEAVNDGVYTVDAEGRFTMVNGAYAEMMGVDREAVLGEHVSTVVSDETVERAKGLERELIDGERETARVETEVRVAAAEDIWVEATLALLPGDSAEYRRAAVVRDVTDRVEREQVLEEYRAFTQIASDVIVTIDGTGTVRSVNPAVEDSFGYRPEELVGEPLTTLMPAGLAERHSEQFQRYLDEGTPHADWDYFSLRGLHKDGTEFPVAISFSELERNGKRFFTGVIRDDTERKEYENRLEEMVEKLERSNERLERFAYLASHDLQEPLRMISNFLGLLERRYRDELDEEAREFIDFATDGAERMREMINDLLTYSRVETRAKPFEETDVETIVDHVLENLRLQIEESDVTVTVESLPTVVADANQLEQVFQNLVSNAIKYRDGDDPQVHIGVEEAADGWTFRVSDNGIGIDPEMTDRVFEMFGRLHTNEEYSGTGVGLALCERIVDRHDGTIRDESEPGEGSTFLVTIPRLRAGESAEELAVGRNAVGDGEDGR